MSRKIVAHEIADSERTKDIEINEKLDFSSLFLCDVLLDGLQASGFVRPSPIQLKAIPLGRCGLDLIVQAKSGTGKTCVFSVIALDGLVMSSAAIQVLVLAPTREIALQIGEVIQALGSSMASMRCETFIGGMPLSEDRQKLKSCHIAIGTPGRVKQLIEQDLLRTDSIRLFVLDEADKLLEESFQKQVNWIYSALPENKQIVALSATYPEYLAQHLTAYMRDPTFVRLNSHDPALLGIKQYYKSVRFHPLPNETFNWKCAALKDLLSKVSFQQCLVFSNYQTRAEDLSNLLNAAGWPSAYIAGSHDQRSRNETMEKLKTFKCRILISTDLTSRGIDCDKVNLVVNLDLPMDHETYLHRIGRAGRFGSFGAAVSLVSEGKEQKTLLEKIERKCNTKIKPLPDPIPSNLTDSSQPVYLDDLVTSEQMITRDSTLNNDDVTNCDVIARVISKTAVSDKDAVSVGNVCAKADITTENGLMIMLNKDHVGSIEDLRIGSSTKVADVTVAANGNGLSVATEDYTNGIHDMLNGVYKLENGCKTKQINNTKCDAEDFACDNDYQQVSGTIEPLKENHLKPFPLSQVNNSNKNIPSLAPEQCNQPMISLHLDHVTNELESHECDLGHDLACSGDLETSSMLQNYESTSNHYNDVLKSLSDFMINDETLTENLIDSETESETKVSSGTTYSEASVSDCEGELHSKMNIPKLYSIENDWSSFETTEKEVSALISEPSDTIDDVTDNFCDVIDILTSDPCDKDVFKAVSKFLRQVSSTLMDTKVKKGSSGKHVKTFSKNRPELSNDEIDVHTNTPSDIILASLIPGNEKLDNVESKAEKFREYHSRKVQRSTSGMLASLRQMQKDPMQDEFDASSATMISDSIEKLPDVIEARAFHEGLTSEVPGKFDVQTATKSSSVHIVDGLCYRRDYLANNPVLENGGRNDVDESSSDSSNDESDTTESYSESNDDDVYITGDDDIETIVDDENVNVSKASDLSPLTRLDEYENTFYAEKDYNAIGDRDYYGEYDDELYGEENFDQSRNNGETYDKFHEHGQVEDEPEHRADEYAEDTFSVHHGANDAQYFHNHYKQERNEVWNNGAHNQNQDGAYKGFEDYHEAYDGSSVPHFYNEFKNVNLCGNTTTDARTNEHQEFYDSYFHWYHAYMESVNYWRNYRVWYRRYSEHAQNDMMWHQMAHAHRTMGAYLNHPKNDRL